MRRFDVAWTFKVRSPGRDARTDRDRFGSLSRSISFTIEAVRAERDALRSRVDVARDHAALIAGTGIDDYLSRDPKDAAQLRDYEQQMAAGNRRISELERQLEGLDALLKVYTRFFADFVGEGGGST
jgi:hypothetical protein